VLALTGRAGEGKGTSGVAFTSTCPSDKPVGWQRREPQPRCYQSQQSIQFMSLPQPRADQRRGFIAVFVSEGSFCLGMREIEPKVTHAVLMCREQEKSIDFICVMVFSKIKTSPVIILYSLDACHCVIKSSLVIPKHFCLLLPL